MLHAQGGGQMTEPSITTVASNARPKDALGVMSCDRITGSLKNAIRVR